MPVQPSAKYAQNSTPIDLGQEPAAVQQYTPAQLLYTTKYDRVHDREVQSILDKATGKFDWLGKWFYYKVWGGTGNITGAKELNTERASIAKVKTTLDELVNALAIAKIMPTVQHDTAAVQKAEVRVNRATDAYLEALVVRAKDFAQQEQAPIFLAGRQEIADRIANYNNLNFENEKNGWFWNSTNENYIPPSWMNTVVSPRLSSDMLTKFGYDITPKVIESKNGLVSIYDQADTYANSFGKITNLDDAIITLRNETRRYHSEEFAQMIETISSPEYIVSEIATKTAEIDEDIRKAKEGVKLAEAFIAAKKAPTAAPVAPTADAELAKQLDTAKNELAGHLNARQLLLNNLTLITRLDLEALTKEVAKDDDKQLLTKIAAKLNLPTAETSYINLANATTNIITAKAQVQKIEAQMAAKAVEAPKQPALAEASLEQLEGQLEQAKKKIEQLTFNRKEIEKIVTEETKELAKKLTLFTAQSKVSDEEFVELVKDAKREEIEQAAGRARVSAKQAQRIAKKLDGTNVGPGILNTLQGFTGNKAETNLFAEILDAHAKKPKPVAKALDAHTKKPQPIEGQGSIKLTQSGSWTTYEAPKANEEPKAATALKNEDILRSLKKTDLTVYAEVVEQLSDLPRGTIKMEDILKCLKKVDLKTYRDVLKSLDYDVSVLAHNELDISDSIKITKPEKTAGAKVYESNILRRHIYGFVPKTEADLFAGMTFGPSKPVVLEAPKVEEEVVIEDVTEEEQVQSMWNKYTPKDEADPFQPEQGQPNLLDFSVFAEAPAAPKPNVPEFAAFDPLFNGIKFDFTQPAAPAAFVSALQMQPKQRTEQQDILDSVTLETENQKLKEQLAKEQAQLLAKQANKSKEDEMEDEITKGFNTFLDQQAAANKPVASMEPSKGQLRKELYATGVLPNQAIRDEVLEWLGA